MGQCNSAATVTQGDCRVTNPLGLLQLSLCGLFAARRRYCWYMLPGPDHSTAVHRASVKYGLVIKPHAHHAAISL